MNREEIYQKLKEHPKNVRFEELCRAAELFGFVFRVAKAATGYLLRRA
jgi:hypothetical protein